MAYTYLIGWSKLDRWYYGVKYAGRRSGCDPKNFWVTYFTSSTVVKEYRNTHGDPDVIQIRKLFESENKAIDHEHKVLRRMQVIKKDKWLNRHCGRALKMTKELRAKMRASQLGKVATPEARAKMSVSQRRISPEIRAKMKEATIAAMAQPDVRTRMNAWKRNMSAETRAKLATAAKNKSPETRRKLSERMIALNKNPEMKVRKRANREAAAASRKAEKLANTNTLRDFIHESN